MNTLKTGLLLAVLTLILVVGGQALGGQQGMALALVIAVVMNFAAYFWSDKIALAISGAQPVTAEQAPQLYRIVEGLCARSGLPTPRLYIIPQMQPNAFATGRSPERAAVAVTEGLLQTMNQDELEGVIAHELAHVKNRDTLIMAMAATLAGAITYLAHVARWGLLFSGYGGRDRNGGGNALSALLMIILAPLAALLIQLWISRTREFEADAGAAKVVGHPFGLIRALEKLGHFARRVPMQGVEPATAHLYIVNPFSGSGLASLFSTHPPIEERIKRLQSLS
ncbi:MAG TPA: zinc metalloprotease HtpX [Candidatus Xenobia bacterium]|nr:zinc metalloprotease HtpX [Candidatus Xenobia bacterium]